MVIVIIVVDISLHLPVFTVLAAKALRPLSAHACAVAPFPVPITIIVNEQQPPKIVTSSGLYFQQIESTMTELRHRGATDKELQHQNSEDKVTNEERMGCEERDACCYDFIWATCCHTWRERKKKSIIARVSGSGQQVSCHSTKAAVNALAWYMIVFSSVHECVIYQNTALG